MLSPFSDPLRDDFLLPLLLKGEREEVYTSILRWALRCLTVSQALDVLGIPAAGMPADAVFDTDCGIKTEVQVWHGGKVGRLDLVVCRQNDWLAVVEVKTKGYAEGAIEKHNLYRDAAELRPLPDGRLVFLAVEHDERIGLLGFQFRSWKQVCARLRAHAKHVINTKTHTTSAQYLAVIGAIEQNLLGLGIKSGQAYLVVDHLNNAFEKTGETMHLDSAAMRFMTDALPHFHETTLALKSFEEQAKNVLQEVAEGFETEFAHFWYPACRSH